MTDWEKQGFGPGTNICARCKQQKESRRLRSKWCSTCDNDMKSRRADGALDRPTTGLRVTRPSRIIR